MAERRMFAKTIIDSDAFLALPISTQLLYFHIGVRAADNGMINNIISICRAVDLDTDNISRLEESGFLIVNNDHCIIVHWDENNGIGVNAKKRLSYKYRQWRKSVLERDGYRCRTCHEQEKIMHVHHILSFSKYPELRCAPENGMTLCPKCHLKIHGGSWR
jgi:hypothetical protein